MRCRIAQLRIVFLGSALLAALEFAFAALTITEKTTPTLGTLLSGASGRNFILNTDQTVSGTDSADYLFGAVSGDLTVKKTGGGQSADILADNITTSGDIIVNSVLCKYGTGSQTDCSSSALNVTVSGTKALMIGIDFDTNAIHSGGDSTSVTFDINITLL
jgi:hypothetical protein